MPPVSSQPSEGLTALHHSIAGGLSGCLTRVCLQPIDVLKIRFQLQIGVQTSKDRKQQIKSSHVNKKYKNMVQATRLIIQEEGLKALWKGHVPAQLLSVAYGAVQFVCFEKYTTILVDRFPEWSKRPHWKAVSPFICGGLAGVSATAIAQPLDVLRTRLVAQGHLKIYNGLMDAVRQMYIEHGIRTFYKGTLPTVIAILPNAGCHFGFYQLFRRLWKTSFNKLEWAHYIDGAESLICGAASGLVSKVLLLPFDTVKKRLQVAGFEKARQPFGATVHYHGMIDCCQKIFMMEGLTGFYKGTGPSMVKSALSVALTFFFYEQVCIWLKSLR